MNPTDAEVRARIAAKTCIIGALAEKQRREKAQGQRLQVNVVAIDRDADMLSYALLNAGLLATGDEA